MYQPIAPRIRAPTVPRPVPLSRETPVLQVGVNVAEAMVNRGRPMGVADQKRLPAYNVGRRIPAKTVKGGKSKIAPQKNYQGIFLPQNLAIGPEPFAWHRVAETSFLTGPRRPWTFQLVLDIFFQIHFVFLFAHQRCTKVLPWPWKWPFDAVTLPPKMPLAPHLPCTPIQSQHRPFGTV